MKVKVLAKFRDKHNLKKVYKVGEVIEVSEERYEEILLKGKLVEPIEEDVEDEDGDTLNGGEGVTVTSTIFGATEINQTVKDDEE